ncbi:MAG: hypothetical protein Solivirus5_9 [Solivirus sp.]|uniref:Peptidase C1A papain C-terminal domain-containing protein n=1 Tax=Solivirus sp. TaxID=2487772 RepID=A0A3G5AIF0_9VIRU|nr:MAG: hypothetical protein Solivirus5_9 [Solivirus sp.]
MTELNEKPKHRYDFKKSKRVATDKLYASHPKFGTEQLETLPFEVDLRDQMPPVYDQGQLGSCTANAGCAAFEYDERAQQEIEGGIKPSRRFLYFIERELDNDINQDGGSTLRTCISAIDQFGICNEDLCPYSEADFAVKPSEEAYSQASQHKGVNSFSLDQTLYQLHHCLAVNKRPFIFGTSIYESFESAEVAQTGVVPVPGFFEKRIGGHALCCVGYKPGYFIVRNSWGATWGDGGYCYIPQSYMLDYRLTSDFWCLEKIV